MDNLIGRIQEREILKEVSANNKSELIVVFGRRRVGKTFLIKEHFKKEMIFSITGLFGGELSDQLANFTKELRQRQKRKKIEKPKNWQEAFTLLENYIDRIKSKKKKVIFIDEFPWIATQKSKFLMMFENFWNQYVTKRDDLIVVICGSAASYMVQKIINNKGGLHNRITRKIRLLPFNLYETKLYLNSRGIKYTHYDILQLYMTIGGIPHYLEKIKKGRSVAQNIDQLCFSKDGILRTEFDSLYASLFKDSDKHIKIIRAIATASKGITRQQIIKKSGLPSGGDVTLKLMELSESGFITEYSYFNNKRKHTLYRLTDEYTMFYLKFIEKVTQTGVGYWQKLHSKRSYTAWSGFRFETLCLKHINQIKKQLGIAAIYSTNSSWFNKNAQIDLLIDRADNIINLCEMKFYDTPFTIDKKNYLNLKNKIAEFKKATKTRKNIYIAMITTYGLKANAYSNELVQNSLDMECLFLE